MTSLNERPSTKQESSDYYGEGHPDDGKVKQLKAENIKLRELVDELWAIAYGYAPDESELDCARDMMREHGIEVPE